MIFELTNIQNEMRELFENSPYRWIVNVGGKGSGKTDFATYIIIKMLFDERYKGSRILIARETLRDLKNTLLAGIDRKIRENPLMKAMIKTNSNLQNIINVGNEVEVYYLSLSDKNQQYKSILSYEFNVIIIDEADRITEQAFDEVSERFRLLHPFQKGMLILNPCSQEHWIYKRFVSKPRDDAVVIKSTTYDNYIIEKIPKEDLSKFKVYELNGRKYLVKNNVRYEPINELGNFIIAKRFNVSHGFLVEMENKPLAYKRIMLYGEWGAYDYGGGLFEDVFSEENIVDKDFSIYDLTFDFTLYCGIDFGIRHNAYCLLGVDVFGNMYIIDDFISTNMSVRNFIEFMLRRFNEKLGIKRPQYIVYVGDVSGKNRELYDGHDLFSKIKKEFGLNLYGQKVRVLESIAVIKDLLHEKKLLVSDRASFSLEGFLGRFKSDGFGNPIKDGFYDHLLDAIRYAVMYATKEFRSKSMRTIEKPTIGFTYKYGVM